MSAPSETRAREPRHATERCDDWKILCPECGGSAFAAGSDLFCPREGRRIERSDGILPLLKEARQRELSTFLEDYLRVRRDEGWGGAEEYYRSLPFEDRTGRHRAIWPLRARSYRAALTALERHFPNAKRNDEWNRRSLSMLELGAGNGWFSWRMAESGHQVLATDISIDESDGLNAVFRYAYPSLASRRRLTLARAEMENLPLEDAQFDVVVANGSLHYAGSLRRVVEEAHRLLRRRGLFLVLDSPTYSCRADGEAMVRRREAEHAARYGIRAKIQQVGFLVAPEFRALLERSGFRVTTSLPFEGVARATRRAYCRLRRLAPPARFPLFAAEKSSS